MISLLFFFFLMYRDYNELSECHKYILKPNMHFVYLSIQRFNIYPCINAFGGKLDTLLWNAAAAVSKFQPLCSANI